MVVFDFECFNILRKSCLLTYNISPFGGDKREGAGVENYFFNSLLGIPGPGELSNCRDDIVARRSSAEDGGHALFQQPRLVGRADNRPADHERDALAASLEGSEQVVQIMDVLPRMTADAD